MATLTITETFTDLDAGAPSVLTAGSGLDTIRHAVRDVIVNALPLVDGGSMNAAARQGLVAVTVEVGVDEPVQPDTPDASGFMIVRSAVTIPDDLVYDFTDTDGPVAAFITEVKNNVVAAFTELSDFDAIVSGLGIGSATIRLTTSVVLNG